MSHPCLNYIGEKSVKLGHLRSSTIRKHLVYHHYIIWKPSWNHPAPVPLQFPITFCTLPKPTFPRCIWMYRSRWSFWAASKWENPHWPLDTSPKINVITIQVNPQATYAIFFSSGLLGVFKEEVMEIFCLISQHCAIDRRKMFWTLINPFVQQPLYHLHLAIRLFCPDFLVLLFKVEW